MNTSPENKNNLVVDVSTNFGTDQTRGHRIDTPLTHYQISFNSNFKSIDGVLKLFNAFSEVTVAYFFLFYTDNNEACGSIFHDLHRKFSGSFRFFLKMGLSDRLKLTSLTPLLYERVI